MSINVQCECGNQFRVKDEAAGRKVKCPQCSAANTVPVEESIAQPLRKSREPRRGKKAKNSTSPFILGGIAAAILTLCVVVYAFMRSGKENPEIASTPAVPVVPQTDHPVDLPAPLSPVIENPIPQPESTTTLQYGPEPPSGKVLSLTLIHEYETMMAEEMSKSGHVSPAKEIKDNSALGISLLRGADPEYLCYSSEQEARFAAGQFDDAETLNRFNAVLGKLASINLDFPAIVSQMKEDVLAGRIQGARLELLTGLAEVKYYQATFKR